MTEEERWLKVREIVREENEKSEARILAVLGKSKKKIEVVNGRWVGVTDDQVAAWREAFPAVDVDGELKKMAAWIVSNPMMAPKSQYGRFAHAWLSKCQNQSSLRSIPTRQPDTHLPGPGKKLCAYCDRVANGSVNGIWNCHLHTYDAMDQKPSPKMRGVPAKAVAGE